jgi:hypothetical protein
VNLYVYNDKRKHQSLHFEINSYVEYIAEKHVHREKNMEK